MPGYLLTEDGQQREVYLKVATSKTSPDRVSFRTGPAESGVQHLAIDAVKAYGTHDHSERYVRFTVRIDTSRQRLSELTTARQPEWKEKTVLLRQLVEGAADLFHWSDGKREAYLLREGDQVPQVLIARQYRGQGRTIHRDHSYIAQLAALAPCSDAEEPLGFPAEVGYRERDLVEYIAAYSRCRGEIPTIYQRKREAFRVWVNAGVDYGQPTYEILPSRSNRLQDLGTALLPRLGVSVEYLMPFARERYSLYIGVDYRLHRTYDFPTPRYGQPWSRRLEYGAVNFPLGVRRYLRLGDWGELLLMAGGVMDIPLGRGLYDPEGRLKSIATDANFGPEAGLGIALGDRYRLMVRHQFSRNISPGFRSSRMAYRATYLMVGYRLH